MLIDAHCHLNRLNPASFGGSIEAAWEDATRHGIGGCLIPSTTKQDWEEITQLAGSHQDLWGAIAVHPSEADTPPVQLDELIAAGSPKQIVAIGETGLDFCHEVTPAERGRQNQLFELHIQAALQLGKFLVVHAREAWPQLLDTLHRFPVDQIGGMVHCFTGDYAAAKAILDLGWYLSFSGIITFKRSAALRELLTKIPPERILLETDAPYLAPEPMRGRPNLPSFLIYTASVVAEISNRSRQEVEGLTYNNFLRLLEGNRH